MPPDVYFRGLLRLVALAGAPSAATARVQALRCAPRPDTRGPRQPCGGVEEVHIPRSGGEDDGCASASPPPPPLRARLYRPPSSAAPGAPPPPLLVWLHGGGWVSGTLEDYDCLCRALCNATGAAVVAVDYRLAPEAPFPAALDDACAAARWAARCAHALRLDGTRLALAGDSAGGNLAAAASLQLTAEADAARAGDSDADDASPPPPRPRAVVLFYPALDAADERPSYEQYTEGYGLSREDMRAYWAHYLDAAAASDASEDSSASAAARRADARASPLRAPRASLATQPRTHIVTAECDVLRDEGEAYAAALRRAGAAEGLVTLTRYEGVIHGFLATGHALPASEAALLEAARVLRAALGVEEEEQEGWPAAAAPHVSIWMRLRQTVWRLRVCAHRARICTLLRAAALLPPPRQRGGEQQAVASSGRAAETVGP
jgi:acetyl esterase